MESDSEREIGADGITRYKVIDGHRPNAQEYHRIVMSPPGEARGRTTHIDKIEWPCLSSQLPNDLRIQIENENGGKVAPVLFFHQDIPKTEDATADIASSGVRQLLASQEAVNWFVEQAKRQSKAVAGIDMTYQMGGGYDRGADYTPEQPQQRNK
jgi:hypothetical protein